MIRMIGLGAFFVTKKVKISFLILVWSIVAVQMFVNYRDATGDSKRAVTAFSVVDENVTGETIRGYGYFGKLDISDEMKKNMLKNLALKLGIEDGYSFTKGKGDGFTKMTLTKEGKYATTMLRIITILGDDKPEQHITVQISTVSDIKAGFELYDRTKQVFDEIGVDGQVSMEIEMEKEGNVVSYGGENVVESIFDLAQAKRVDEIEENDIHTVYGYTKQENSHLVMNGKKINIQIVMSYDEGQDKTYVKVGLPIVNSSY